MPYAYAQQRQYSPASLVAAIGINAAILGAVITAAPDVLKIVERPPLITKNIPLPPDPKPIPDEIKPVDPKPMPLPYVPERIVEIVPPSSDTVIALGKTPVIDPGTVFGNGTDPVVIDPPVAPPATPLLIGAQPDPAYLNRFQPPYPPAKQRMGEEGAVRVRFLIGADGRVKSIEPVGAVDPDFYAATRRQALSQWRFKPATRGGTPVESWQTRTVRFVITN